MSLTLVLADPHPVVLLTFELTSDQAATALRLGVDGVVLKPG